MSPVTSRRRGRDEESIAAVADKGVEGEVAADDMETGMGGGVGGAASSALDFEADPPPAPPVACDSRSCFFNSSKMAVASAFKGFISVWYCFAIALPSGVRLIHSALVVLMNAHTLIRSSTCDSEPKAFFNDDSWFSTSSRRT